MNDITKLSDIVKNSFKKEVIDKAEKYVNNENVAKCAESIKNFINDAIKLKNNEERIAAILLAEKLLEDEYVDNIER